MKSFVNCSALGAILFALSGIAQAATTLEIISDNDFAVFVGSSTEVSRLIYQSNVSWPDQVSAAGSFDFEFQTGETTVYLLAMGGGGVEDIGGTMNDVDLTTIDVSESSDLSAVLTNYTTSSTEIAAGTYSATLADVSAAVPTLTWGNPTVTNSGVGSIVTGSAFTHGSDTAVIYRFSAADIGAVPEPGVPILGVIAGFIFMSRRRRTAA